MNPLYPEVARRAGNRCEYCHAPQSVVNFEFEVEHVTPLTSGGSNDLNNLALSCRACNAFKAARQTGIDLQTQTVVPLFHPRQDVWADHFSVDTQTLTITGLTLTGRATVATLQMDSLAQQTARRLWQILELFP